MSFFIKYFFKYLVDSGIITNFAAFSGMRGFTKSLILF